MDGMSEIERLMALEDIMVLKARRDRLVDAQDWDGYEALHAPDHKSHNDGHEPWNSAAEMIANLRLFMDGMITVHHSHTPEITFESPTRASGIWGVEDFVFWPESDDHLQGFGHYYETYEKRDGRWLFTSRSLRRTHVRVTPGAQARIEARQVEERARFGRD